MDDGNRSDKPDKITKQFVDSRKQPGEWSDSELKGFRLKVTPKGKKVYFVENSVKGGRPSVTVTIGQHGVWTAETARAEARRLLLMMSQGIDPNRLKKEQAAQEAAAQAKKTSEARVQDITVRRVLRDYCESRNLKDSTISDYHLVLHRCAQDWLDLPLILITKEMVEQRHRKLSDRKAQANKVGRVLRALFNYDQVTYEDHEGNPFVQDNPVRRLSQVKAWNRVPRRQTVIAKHQLKPWYRAVMSLTNPTIKDYFRLLLFTGLRRHEAKTLKWSNVHFEAGYIKVEDTKNHEDHMLPMTDVIRDMLRARWQTSENEYVFPGTGRNGYLVDSRKQMLKVTELSGVPFTVHDIRRTFATVAQGLDIEGYTLKRLLNHKTTSDVTAGYLIADVERLRQPMEKITEFFKQQCDLSTIVETDTKGAGDQSNVIALTAH